MNKATVSRSDGEDWFKALCAEHGLTPAKPKLAEKIVAGDILFTVTGNPRPVASVRVNKRTVRIKHPMGEDTVWDIGTSVSLIACAIEDPEEDPT